MVLSILGSLVLSSQAAQTPTVKFDTKESKTQFQVGTQSLGTNQTTVNGETITSVTKLDKLVTLESALILTVKNGKIVNWKLSESDGKSNGVISYQNGKLSITSNGKETVKDKPIQLSQVLFSNWHPVLWNTLLPAAKNATNGKFKLTPINALTEIEVTGFIKEEQATVPSGKAVLEFLNINLAGINLRIAYENGLARGLYVPVQNAKFITEGYEEVFIDPLLKYKELSQPTYKTVTEQKVETPLSDGVKLVSTIVRPNDSEKHPAILVRTPYGRSSSAFLEGEMYASRGYVYICQDVRGTGDSDGRFDPLNTEVRDGKDTLDWIQNQPWSNGKVGMIGASYGGYVQWAAAVNHHPALKCIIPQVSPPEPTRNFPYDNGELMLMMSLWWARIVADKKADLSTANQPIAGSHLMAKLPISTVDNFVLKRNVDFFDNWITRDTPEKWKGAFTTKQVATVQIPVLHVSGTFDGDGVGTQIHWQTLRAANKKNQWLIFGPWEHAFNTKDEFGGEKFGSQSILELNSVYLRFFDTFLKDKQVNWDSQPKVRFFATGSNKWILANDWPLPEAKQVKFYLGKGNAKQAKASLSGTPPPASKDSYLYNPNKHGKDKKSISVAESDTSVTLEQLKADGLVYRTEPMMEPTTYAGTAQVHLEFSTTAKDASFYAILFDEDPNGKLRVIAMPGKQRATYINEKYQILTPNKPYSVTVEPWWFCRTFKKGHRLVLFVTSDSFPGYARNPGTGESIARATKLINATHTIYKGGDKASFLRLWKLPNP